MSLGWCARSMPDGLRARKRAGRDPRQWLPVRVSSLDRMRELYLGEDLSIS
jgi:hypothetical protein